MDIKKWVLMAVSVITAAVVFGACLPVFADTTQEEDTLTNEGIFNARSIDATSNVTLSFDHTNPTVITVNGSDIDMTNTPSTYGAVTIAFADDWFIRYIPIDGGEGAILYKCGTISANPIITGSVASEKDLNVSISNGTANITDGETTAEYTVTDGVVISPEKSDYVIKKATDTAFVNADSVVYGAGRTDRALGTSGTSFNAIGSATIEDGVTLSYYSPQYTVADTSSVEYTEVDNYIDLYQLSGYTFNLTANGVNYSVVYTQIFVPSEVSAERSIHPEGATKILMDLLPVLIGAGLLMGVAGYVIRRKL